MATVNEKAPAHIPVFDGGEVEAQPERGIAMDGGTRGTNKRKRGAFAKFGIQVFFMVTVLALVCAAVAGVFQIKKDVDSYVNEANGVATTHNSIAARDTGDDVLFHSGSSVTVDIDNVKAVRDNAGTSVDCDFSMTTTSATAFSVNSVPIITASLTGPLSTITVTVTLSMTTETIGTVTAGTATSEQTTIESTGAITAPGPVSSGICAPVTVTITLSQVSPVSSSTPLVTTTVSLTTQITTTISFTTMFTTVTATSTQAVAGASLGGNSASSPLSTTVVPSASTTSGPAPNRTSEVSPVGTTMPAPVINSSSISFTLSGSGWASSMPANTTYAMPTSPSATTALPSYATTSGGGSASAGYSDGVSGVSYTAVLLATVVFLLI